MRNVAGPISKSLAEQGDISHQAAFFYKCVSPHFIHQCIFRNYLTSILDQDPECVQNFWRELYYVAISPQFALYSVKPEIRELIYGADWTVHGLAVRTFKN